MADISSVHTVLFREVLFIRLLPSFQNFVAIATSPVLFVLMLFLKKKKSLYNIVLVGFHEGAEVYAFI